MQSHHNRKVVYTIVPRDGRSYWVKIGRATTLADGTIHMKLDAPPSFGAVQLRDAEPESPSEPEHRSRDGGEPSLEDGVPA